MRIHLIAIGGAVMHNIAIVLKRQGHTVSGSDDAINDPAKTNLANEGLLPKVIGFDAANITPDIDVVILGMHARLDNAELIRAQELGLKVVSFPEYIFEIARNKKRVVIAGSHGKTTITGMVMHVLKNTGLQFDYMVGAKVKGFDTSVCLTDDAPLIVLEGDEYLASPLQPESKFMFYKPHVALISGIAWDHINVFPVYENYVHQFVKFANSIEPDGTLVWCEEDDELKRLAPQFNNSLHQIAYRTPSHEIEDGATTLITETGDYPLKVFGKHNLMNMEGARLVCNAIGISNEVFYEAIQSFEGAANRLQLLFSNSTTAMFKDFAHSPSKLKATVDAVRSQFPQRKLIAVMELHTFSSLNESFLPEYAGAMNSADEAIVYLDAHTFKLKNMQMLTDEKVKEAFANESIQVLRSADALEHQLLETEWNNAVILLMSSGNFGGMKPDELWNKKIVPLT